MESQVRGMKSQRKKAFTWQLTSCSCLRVGFNLNPKLRGFGAEVLELSCKLQDFVISRV